MWRIYFEFTDLLVGLIPNKQLREKIRKYDLYDYRNKFNALRDALPQAEFKHIRVIKGGWNIGFIVDHKYVCKIRKKYEGTKTDDKIMQEKRITDAFAPVVPLRIPHVDIIKSNGFTFYKYDFIPGVNLNQISKRKIVKHGWHLARQLASFIDKMHNTDPAELADLKSGEGDGWHHNDICNNIIVNPKTMDIVGLIDWEYAGWGKLETEFENIARFSKKIRESGIAIAAEIEYHVMQKRKK